MKRGLDAYAKAGAWVGLFRLQLDFRTQISQKAIKKKKMVLRPILSVFLTFQDLNIKLVLCMLML